MAHADDAALELILAAGHIDAVPVGAVLDDLRAVKTVGEQDGGDAPGEVVLCQKLEAERFGAVAAEHGQGPLLAVDGVEAVLEDHGEAFLEATDEVHGRGEVGFALGELLALSGKVEIEAAGLDVLAALPGALREGYEGQSGGNHEALLGAGEQAVDAPLVHGAGGEAHAGDAIHNEKHIRGTGHGGDAFDGMQDTGGGFGHLDEDAFGLRGLPDGLLDFPGADGFAPVLHDFHDLQAMAFGDLAPAFAEFAGVNGNDGFAGFEEAVHGCRHGTAAGAGQRHDGFGGAEEELQLFFHIVHDPVEIRLAVMDHVPGESEADSFGKRRRTGGEKTHFVEHVGKSFGVCAWPAAGGPEIRVCLPAARKGCPARCIREKNGEKIRVFPGQGNEHRVPPVSGRTCPRSRK